MTSIAAKDKSLTPIRFHFYSLKFTPYKGSEHLNTEAILIKVITYIVNEYHKGKGHLIDRHHNRPNDEPRELFMTQPVILLKEKRIRCNIALLRTGRVPMIKPAEQFTLVPLDKANGEIAEQTRFFIDYSKDKAVLCVEYNHHGPRLLDIAYYFRNVAFETLRIAKATETEVYMDTSIDKTLADLKNVLNLEIKVEPKKLIHLDTDLTGSYFTGMSNLGNKIKPKFLKLEAMFQTPGSSIKSKEINTDAVKMVKTFLTRFKGRPFNIDAFDNFVVRYEDKDGKEEVFNLLKGKCELIKDVDLSKISKLRDLYDVIKPDFDDFMLNR